MHFGHIFRIPEQPVPSRTFPRDFINTTIQADFPRDFILGPFWVPSSEPVNARGPDGAQQNCALVRVVAESYELRHPAC